MTVERGESWSGAHIATDDADLVVECFEVELREGLARLAPMLSAPASTPDEREARLCRYKAAVALLIVDARVKACERFARFIVLSSGAP